jgi:ribosomal protein S18 acetylase RimI-like enzyme
MPETEPARPPPYVIRPARAEDVPRLAEIEEISFDPATYGGFLMTAQAFKRQVRSRNFLLVAVPNTPDGEAAGYALGLVRKDSPYVRFISLAVLPEHGGRGAGWRLFDAIENAARDNGYRGVRLEIREDNTRLLARYRRAGYREFAAVPDYYSDGAAAIRMVKDFAPASTPRS